MIRTAILISGGGSNMVRLAESMTGDHPARPVLVVSNRPDAGGLLKARDMGIDTAIVDHKDFADREAFETKLHETLLAANPDVICLAGFMRVLNGSFVQKWQGRMLNIHPSLLPKYKGLHTHQRAIEAGETEAGVTVHMVTPALDDGPILGQARVPVLASDTPDDLAARVLKAEHALYPAVFRRFVEQLN
ncbi:phosphoribosylglycinamide formyltransferase [Donghicola mangrovi]|uniref:Phosphoribosylglycinamide formyltransferase n=1 Tax=Donghicola mangrovi TaxID=2729614 RepID=A0A850Q299_9RHOB|nr:phosphoribosylglycinamide formyltransferase [Donghicola mangrovi]NVO23094.1 phosphoribosylglycinamide formyltransferase [Donghicola mangrovi]